MDLSTVSAYKNSGCVVKDNVFEVILTLLLVLCCEECTVICTKSVLVVMLIESELNFISAYLV